jgi:hypothetical protein
LSIARKPLEFVAVAEHDFMSSSGEDRSELPPINPEVKTPISMLLHRDLPT